jgi:hypothetical protein
MLDQTFYWGTVRKAIVAFGNMFNNITIERKDSAGNTVQIQKVPLAYSPNQKFLTKIRQQPNVDTQNIQIVLPRMGFELVSLDYDPTRKVGTVQQTRSIKDPNLAKTLYAPTPYNLNVLLYVYAKNQDDGLQIIEQIIPYFNPDYNLTLKAIPELNLQNDLPILLSSIGFSDDYEGDLTTRRSIIWTLSFTMKLNFYGPATNKGLIKKVTATTFNDPTLTTAQQKGVVQPNPPTANVTDSYGYIDTFTDF